MKSTLFIYSAITLLTIVGCHRPDCPEPIAKTANFKLTSANGKDANICQNILLSGSNYSSTKYLVAQSWTNGGLNQDQFILIDFDLSSIPVSARITGATLTMYSDTTRAINGSPGKGHYQTSGDNSAYLRRITSAWDESTISFDNKPSSDNVGEITIPSTTSAADAYVIDVTELVKTEHASETSYHGFMIGMINPNQYRQVVFYSSDCEFPDLTPELKVDYTIYASELK